MDLYDDVLAASSQPPESRTSSSEPPPEIRQEPSPKPNNKSPAILYTYSGLRNKRAAVYVGSFSWVSASGAYAHGGPPEKPPGAAELLGGAGSALPTLTRRSEPGLTLGCERERGLEP